MDNANRFLEAFAKIENECRQIAKENHTSKFYFVLQEAAKRNSVVYKYQTEIQEYADLRNAIIHQRTDKGEIIAIPVDTVVNEIEKIYLLLCKPILVQDHFIKKVVVARSDDSIENGYHKMKELQSSKLPIIQDQKFYGLLTIDQIANWAMNDREKYKTIKELMNVKSNDKIYFISKVTPLFEVLEYFDQSVKKGYSILAILITENGNQTEKLLGIITVADIPKIISILE